MCGATEGGLPLDGVNVAKEAVISSWAQTYAVAEPAEGADPGDLGGAIGAAFERSSGGHPLPAVWAFLVFLMAYTPCVATIASCCAIGSQRT